MDSTQIPALTLPSGGTVEFVDLDDLTGADLASIRRVVRREDAAGEQTNLVFQEAMRIAIKTWDIPYLEASDPRTPQANPAAWKRLRLRDLRAIEVALQPFLDIVNGDKAVDDGAPGSPPRPESE